jgi:hypothetical protein
MILYILLLRMAKHVTQPLTAYSSPKNRVGELEALYWDTDVEEGKGNKSVHGLDISCSAIKMTFKYFQITL